MSRLSAGARRLLVIVSVIGDWAPVRLVERVLGRPRGLAPLLAEIRKHEILHEESRRGETVLQCNHPLMRRAVYESLPVEERRTLHAAVGAALEELHAGRLQDVYELLAYHYGRSADSAKAIAYLPHLLQTGRSELFSRRHRGGARCCIGGRGAPAGGGPARPSPRRSGDPPGPSPLEAWPPRRNPRPPAPPPALRRGPQGPAACRTLLPGACRSVRPLGRGSPARRSGSGGQRGRPPAPGTRPRWLWQAMGLRWTASGQDGSPRGSRTAGRRLPGSANRASGGGRGRRCGARA